MALLTERGHRIERFDPCFAPNEHVLAATHDFVTCTEVIEHFHEPRRELAAIARLLHPGAYLAVTTAFVNDDIDFETWWYARDETHVSFYRPQTMEWIGARFGWELLELSDGGALFVSR
jgi:hypothetical protein